MDFKNRACNFLSKVTPGGIVTRCSMSCPYKWVGDGRCQLPCNTTSCEHDGGDCIKQQSVGAAAEIIPDRYDHQFCTLLLLVDVRVIVSTRLFVSESRAF